MTTKIVDYSSSLADKIKIMQAVLNGIPVQIKHSNSKVWNDNVEIISWDWTDIHLIYRIKPKEPREFYIAIAQFDQKETLMGTSFERKSLEKCNIDKDITIIKVREILENVSSITEKG